ncbi:MAG: hypothetical protein QMC83_05130 [Thermodesulfovibrionales bacterium]|nr:hypothetical protein [Thermodesulfovibrionales bacterium]
MALSEPPSLLFHPNLLGYTMPNSYKLLPSIPNSESVPSDGMANFISSTPFLFSNPK